MSCMRAYVRRFPRICSALARKAVVQPSLVGQHEANLPQLVVGSRKFSISSVKFSEQTSYNFNIQDEEDFEKRVIKSETPIVIDFHAEWCGPCKLLGPKLEKAVDDHNGKILLAKVDIDDLSEIAMRYQVRAVPTVIGMKGGEAVEKFEGNVPEGDMKAFLNKMLMK